MMISFDNKLAKDLVEEFVEPKNPSQREFAKKIKWTLRKLNEIIKGKRNITAMTAIDLSNALGTSPEFRLNLQSAWDLDQAYKIRKAS